MKMLMPVAALLLLASCNEKKSSSSPSPITPEQVIERLEGSLKELKVGDGSHGTFKGEQWFFNQDMPSLAVVPHKTTFDLRSWKVTLKVEGDKYYSFERSLHSDNTASDQISIYSKGKELNDLRMVLEAPGSSASNGRISFKITTNDVELDSIPSENAIITANSTMNGSVSMANPLCDVSFNLDYHDIVASINNVTQPLAAASIQTQINCEKVTLAQVKALDLSSITVCDETTDETNCSDDQDMRHLTADL